MVNIKAELVKVAKAFCEANGINCKRFSMNMIEIAYKGTRSGYESCIAYFTNKSANTKLYIEYDISRGIDCEVFSF